MKKGKSLHYRFSAIMHLAPELPLSVKSELLNCSNEEFEKFLESKGGIIVRSHKENPILKGAQLPQLRDWDMEEMNTSYANVFEELKSMREKI